MGSMETCFLLLLSFYIGADSGRRRPLGGVLPVREPPEQLPGLENTTRAYMDKAVNSKLVKFHFWVSHPFNLNTYSGTGFKVIIVTHELLLRLQCSYTCTQDIQKDRQIHTCSEHCALNVRLNKKNSINTPCRKHFRLKNTDGSKINTHTAARHSG